MAESSHDPVELLFRSRWRTLGEAMHYEVHLRLGSGDWRIEWESAPDFHSSSVVGGGSFRHTEYPSDELVDLIDKRAGKADWQLGERSRIEPALRLLAVYDPVIAELVVRLCILGRVRLQPGRAVRHLDVERLVSEEPFAGDDLKLRRWLARAWELLGVLLATPEQLEAAKRAGAAAQWALDWLAEVGELGPR